jgi:two-component system, NtrC family, sensor kinase
VSPAYAEARRGALSWSGLHPDVPVARVARTNKLIHIVDARLEQSYVERDPRMVELVDLAGARSLFMVPMLKESRLIGAIGVYRQEVRPFTDKQIELVANFAPQAVIAIENTRLLTELRESLQQQTATADVLKVISRSAFDLQTVLDTLVRSAVLLCEADMAAMHEQVGTGYHEVATHGFDQGYKQLILATLPFEAARGSVLGRTVQERRIIHVADVLADPEYTMLEHQRRAGFRAVLGVPLLREGNPVGAIVLMRKMVRPFTDKQIELATTFADQAAIAIENVRLLSELQQRTADLTESLEQQTATSEVLQVISRSPGDLQPVFASMLENAVRICDATFGNIYRWDGELLHLLAAHNTPPALAEFRRRSAIRPSSFVRSMVETKTTVHILDLAAHEDYTDKRVPNSVSAVELGGVRTFLTVPMVRENELIGSFSLYRQEVRPFSDKEIGLVTNFAAQAVIAIENARLLSELRLRTDDLGRSVEELRALGEVSQAVNSTLDLETVLTTVVSRAVHLSRTDAGAIYVFDDERQEFRLHATYGMSETMITAIADQRIGLGDAIGAATALRKPIQVPDIRNEPTSPVNEIIVREGYRGILVIPLLRPDHIVGALVVRRKTPGEFANSTIDLLQTFADQSVVAIQNARLFESVEARTRELAKSLRDLRTAQDRLVQTEKLASLGQLTAGIAHEIKNPLNFVNNFSAVSVELIDELRDALGGAHLDNKLRAEIGEIADTLQGNLDKVVQHGKRADAIVKNMLLHSRQGSGEHRPVDINALVDESLNLAYHGARAEKQGFNITLERSFDPAAGDVDLFPQEITRALLNLISNGFYAASKRKAEANGGDYEPTLSAATKNLGDRVEIRIRDNGTGIPPEVREKLFNPFFTTKPAGEGTGLGLSISHDIIVKQHGGSIEVDTQPGEFTEFRIILPRAGAFVAGR